MKNKLILSIDTFYKKLPELIKANVGFDAVEKNGKIVVTFSGGY